jgi:hypothetical protein
VRLTRDVRALAKRLHQPEDNLIFLGAKTLSYAGTFTEASTNTRPTMK